jgi:predicted MFS family arabinose efflux permease
MAPVIAQLTTERNRPLGFSLFFVLGIGLGILGGLVGGRLPGLVQHSGVASTPAAAKQIAMLFGCGLAALAAWPVSRLRLPAEGPAPRMVYPFNPFLKRFLLVVIIWNLATGSFNPFFNAYFSRFVGASVERIGTVFSGGQLAQIGAMLVAPLVLKRLGLIKGIMSMQLATGMALVGLAAGPVAAAAALTYAAYMAFQWMSEPGIYTLLMNNVRAQERSGASALNFLVVFSSQAVAAATAGAAFTHFGYPAVLAAAAAMAAVSAFLVRVLLPRFDSRDALD